MMACIPGPPTTPSWKVKDLLIISIAALSHQVKDLLHVVLITDPGWKVEDLAHVLLTLGTELSES